MTDLNTSTEVTQTTEPAIAVEPVLAPVFVYEFLYNSDCCEGAASTVSIHKTKKGAEMAMELHKNEKLKEWEKNVKNIHPQKNIRLISTNGGELVNASCFLNIGANGRGYEIVAVCEVTTYRTAQSYLRATTLQVCTTTAMFYSLC